LSSIASIQRQRRASGHDRRGVDQIIAATRGDDQAIERVRMVDVSLRGQPADDGLGAAAAQHDLVARIRDVHRDAVRLPIGGTRAGRGEVHMRLPIRACT